MPEPKMHLVLAGNYRQFMQWCHVYKQSPYNRYVRHVSRPEHLLGYRGDQVIIITTGTWRGSQEWYEQLEVLKALGAEMKHMST